MLKQLSISGFRGFGVQQTLNFALPDNKTPGSGLTIIVGANNTGKTTIIESIQAFNGHTPPSFSEGRRNKKTNEIIEITGTIRCGKYRLFEREIPTGYNITAVRTGFYANKKVTWERYFRVR